MHEKAKNNWQEPNVGKTCAEALVKVTQRLSVIEEQYVALCDLAFSAGGTPTEIEEIGEEVGFFVCTWCKENGSYPSDYLKKEEQFSRGGSDDELSGRVCDTCIEERESDETKRLDTKEK